MPPLMLSPHVSFSFCATSSHFYHHSLNGPDKELQRSTLRRMNVGGLLLPVHFSSFYVFHTFQGRGFVCLFIYLKGGAPYLGRALCHPSGPTHKLLPTAGILFCLPVCPGVQLHPLGQDSRGGKRHPRSL